MDRERRAARARNKANEWGQANLENSLYSLATIRFRRLKASGRPTVLTVNGKAEVVVQDTAAFEEMLDAVHGIQRGLDAMREGLGKPGRTALDEVRAQHRIARRRK